MASQTTTTYLEETLDDIFELLKRKGPLCASQISVELLLPLRRVIKGLIELQKEGLVELRPDRDDTKNGDEELTPWGLSRRLTPR